MTPIATLMLFGGIYRLVDLLRYGQFDKDYGIFLLSFSFFLFIFLILFFFVSFSKGEARSAVTKEEKGRKEQGKEEEEKQ